MWKVICMPHTQAGEARYIANGPVRVCAVVLHPSLFVLFGQDSI